MQCKTEKAYLINNIHIMTNRTLLLLYLFTMSKFLSAQKVINPDWNFDFINKYTIESEKNIGFFRFLFQKELNHVIIISNIRHGWIIQKINITTGNIIWENAQDKINPDSTGSIYFLERADMNANGEIEIIGRRSVSTSAVIGIPFKVTYDFETGKVLNRNDSSYFNPKAKFYYGTTSPSIFIKNKGKYLDLDMISGMYNQFILDELDTSFVYAKNIANIKTINTEIPASLDYISSKTHEDSSNIYVMSYLFGGTYDTSRYQHLYKKISKNGNLIFEKNLSKKLFYEVNSYVFTPISNGFFYSGNVDTTFGKTNVRKAYIGVINKFDLEGNLIWNTFLQDTIGSYYQRNYICEDNKRNGYWALAGWSKKPSLFSDLFFIDKQGKNKKICRVQIPNDKEYYRPKNIWALDNGDLLIGLGYPKCESMPSPLCSKLALINGKNLDKLLNNEDIIEKKVLDFYVYPNPTKEIINIQFAYSLSGKFELINLSGQVIKKQEFENELYIQLNAENLVTGMYIVNIKLNNGLQGFQKIIIQ